ncbi:MAG: hypothetical protein JNL08_08810 [Planctomycetes bacterium]|nr:hypothetical protein [Planctomycetota bacterium]
MSHRSIWFVLLLFLAGCLDFDAQEITLVYDAKADRLDAHFVYRGLFAEPSTDGPDKAMAKALADLAKVRDSGSFHFWNNWPFFVDLTADLPLPVQGLAAHVDVENGTLFVDERGELCGHQFVRVRGARAFVQKLNTLLEVFVQARAAGPIDGRELDEETIELLRDFLRAGNRLLQIEPGRLELRVPCADADHVWLKRLLEQRQLDNLPREMVRRELRERRDAGDVPAESGKVAIDGERLQAAVALAPSFRVFWDNEWSIVREQGLTRIALGVKGADRLVVRKASEGQWTDGLLQALRANGEVVEEKVTDATLAERFAQFRGRDAVLPPRLAERRAGAATTPDAGQQGR